MIKQSYKRAKTGKELSAEIQAQRERDEELSALKNEVARLRIHTGATPVRNFNTRSAKNNNSAKSKMSF